MKAFLSFTLVICSFVFISVAETDFSCDKHVNERFCSSFEDVSSRVIDGPQYRQTRVYNYEYRRYTTERREIFIGRSQVLMACNSSYTFTFNVSNNTNTPDYYSYYSDYNDSDTEIFKCQYQVVDDYRICINDSTSEVAVSIAITFAIV